MDTEKTQVDIPEKQIEMKLVDIPVNDENIALNLLVGFVSVAHKRGVFTLEESSKIWECVKKFQKPE
jgi:hypothetical protein